MTDVETRVEQALATAASRVVVDVDRMWAEYEQPAAPLRSRNRRWRALAPVLAAAGVLAVLVPLGRALNQDEPTAQPLAGQLPALPPWPDGTTVPPKMLPKPAGPVAVFHSVGIARPSTYYLYFAKAPDRVCDIQTMRDVRGTDRLQAIDCHAASSYAAHGLVLNSVDAMFGVAPPGAHALKVRTGTRTATIDLVHGSGLPQPLFFVDVSTGSQRTGRTWSFVSKSGRVLRSSPSAAPTQTTPPDASGTFHPQPATSDIAQFRLPAMAFDPGKSRLLQVYYAGATREYCSREYFVWADGHRTNAGGDCGGGPDLADATAVAFVPWSTNVGQKTGELWGLMPAAATQAAITVDQRLVRLQVAHAHGMPDAAYAGSFTHPTLPGLSRSGSVATRTPSTLYCLDAQGQIVAATGWYLY